MIRSTRQAWEKKYKKRDNHLSRGQLLIHQYPVLLLCLRGVLNVGSVLAAAWLNSKKKNTMNQFWVDGLIQPSWIDLDCLVQSQEPHPWQVVLGAAQGVGFKRFF